MSLRPAVNRVVRYEIAALRDGRWIIECARPSEKDAVVTAQSLLATDRFEAVRVTREREAPGDIVVQTPIFEDSRPPKGKPLPRLSATDDETVWCEALDDLYGGRSRRAIGQLLRGFLDQLGITPTELLHNARFHKKLDAAGGLESAAVHRLARARSLATATPLAQCMRGLEGLLAAASSRARDALALRGVPTLGNDGLGAMAIECRRLAPEPSEQGFLFRHSVCRVLEPRAGLPDRLELALGWAASASDPAAAALVDALVADCLGSAAIVQDMLGHQADLGTALRTTVALAHVGLDADPARAPSWFPALRKLLADRPCPETRAVLLARVRRELAGERPLARGGAPEEARALTALCDALEDDAEGTYAGGTGMVLALAKRWSRLDVPGGFGDLRLPDGDAAQRLREWLATGRRAFGESRKRAVATLALDALRAIPVAARGSLGDLGGALVAAALPAPARTAIAAELASAG